MRYVLIFCFALFMVPGECESQNTYKITYERIYKESDMGSSRKFYTAIVFNDSLYYTYSYEGPDNKIKDNIYGKKILHHSQWYKKGTDELYNGVAWPDKRHPYLVKGKLQQRNWILDTNISHMYQEYRCKKAYAITAPGDTLFVVYTDDIPAAYNFYEGKGLSGVVLESYYTKYNFYVRAVKIEKGDFNVVMPENPKVKDHFDSR